jgi:hypothetical protein
MRPFQPFLSAILTMVLLACSASGQPTRPSAPKQTAAKSKQAAGRAKLTDPQLEAAIRAKFAKSKSANQFRVHVQGGVATIEGKTEVVQHKAAATRMAKTAGAGGVNNKVEISDAAKKKAAGNLEEGRRRVQVKRGDARSSGGSGRVIN